MEALLERLFGQLANLPAWGQFLATALATALGEEIAAVSVWGLARNGTLPWGVAASGVFAGAWTAHALPWAIGRAVGARALTWKIFHDLRANGALARIEDRINRRGWIVLGISRFLPGIRIAVYLLSGILNVHPGVFLPVLTGITLVWMAGTLGVLQLAATLLGTHPVATLLGTAVAAAGIVLWRIARSRKSASRATGGLDTGPAA